MCSTMRLIFNLHSTFNALFNIQLPIQQFQPFIQHSTLILPWVPEAFLAYGGNFRCWPKAEATSGEAARKNLWHGAVLFTVIYTPIRLEVSNCDHVDRHVKKCPTNHIIPRKTS